MCQTPEALVKTLPRPILHGATARWNLEALTGRMHEVTEIFHRHGYATLSRLDIICRLQGQIGIVYQHDADSDSKYQLKLNN